MTATRRRSYLDAIARCVAGIRTRCPESTEVEIRAVTLDLAVSVARCRLWHQRRREARRQAVAAARARIREASQ